LSKSGRSAASGVMGSVAGLPSGPKVSPIPLAGSTDTAVRLCNSPGFCDIVREEVPGTENHNDAPGNFSQSRSIPAGLWVDQVPVQPAVPPQIPLANKRKLHLH